MEDITPRGITALAPETKEQIILFADLISKEVDAGYVNPLSMHIRITGMIQALEKAKEHIRDMVITEAMKHGLKTFDVQGVEVTIGEHGTKYDFTKCCDVLWERFKTDEETAAYLRKEREKFLKGINISEIIVDESTGEVAKVFAPEKKSTTGVTVKFK